MDKIGKGLHTAIKAQLKFKKERGQKKIFFLQYLPNTGFDGV